MNTKTDGYKLREAIKQWSLRKESAEKQFKGTLAKFEGEEKEAPTTVVEAFLTAETAIAQLQVAQMRYNLAIEVTVSGEKMTLGEAIKRVGAAGRIEKMWKTAIPTTGNNRYSVDDGLTRDPNQVRASYVLGVKDLTKLAEKAGKVAGAFRAAIATGNATEVEIKDLDPKLFE